MTLLEDLPNNFIRKLRVSSNDKHYSRSKMLFQNVQFCWSIVAFEEIFQQKYGILWNWLRLRDESWFDWFEEKNLVLLVLGKSKYFLNISVEFQDKGINGSKIVLESFGKNMCQILTIIGKQRQGLLRWEVEMFDDRKQEKFQQRICFLDIFFGIDIFEVDLGWISDVVTLFGRFLVDLT